MAVFMWRVFSRKAEIMAQHNSIGIPSENELKSSPNAVWVEAYTREDGAEVRGHWRSKPERSGYCISAENPVFDTRQGEDYDILGEKNTSVDDILDEDSSASWVSLVLEVIQILFKGTEVGKILETFSPLINTVLPVIFNEDEQIEEENQDEEEIEEDKENDAEREEVQEKSQKEEEKQGDTRQEPDWDKLTKEENITGAAADIKEKELEKDIPEMTKSAELQRFVAKNNPIANNFPEQEYYKISLNLDKVRETGEIPDWMKEHNDVRTLEQVGNKNLAYKIKEKIIKEAKTNNDVETINNPDNIFVITAKPSSDVTKFVINDSKFNETLENKLPEISSGKYKNSYFSFEFKDKENLKDKDKNFSTNHTIGRCDVHNVEIGSDGYLTATIIDYYDFSPKGSFINNNANIQQQNKKLENYALVIPIRMKLKKKQ